MQTPEEIAQAIIARAPYINGTRPQDDRIDLAALEASIAAALRLYGDARAAEERERIKALVLSLRYDDAAIRARDNGDQYFAETGHEQARDQLFDLLS